MFHFPSTHVPLPRTGTGRLRRSIGPSVDELPHEPKEDGEGTVVERDHCHMEETNVVMRNADEMFTVYCLTF